MTRAPSLSDQLDEYERTCEVADAARAASREAECDCQKWLAAEIVRIKYELNGMALIGVKPMWGSLIGRLEQLGDDLKARKR